MSRFGPLVLLLALSLTSCTTVNVDPGMQAASTPTATTASRPATPSSATAAKSPFKKASEVLKDTRKVDGFLTFNVKRDQTTYLTLPPSRMDADMGLVMHYSSGNGTFGIQEGLYLFDTRLMRFERAADKIHLVHRNTRFIADEGTGMQRALEDNIGHSIVQTFDIAGFDSTSGAYVIDFTPFLVSDYADIARGTRFYFQSQREARFDKGSSWVERVQSFPNNSEIDAMLTFRPTAPATAQAIGMADARSFSAGVRYSFFGLPEVPMAARAADNRIGYFIDAAKDFSQDKAFDPMVRHINRWRLEKKDPSAERSEPVTPITFYIDWSVPEEYRPYVHEGVEAWNKAFDAAGFINAIRAVDPPKDDSTWSAEDIRYSTIRWTAAYRMGFAIGPSQTDPRTGEILNADILLSSEFVSGWSSEYDELLETRSFEQMEAEMAESLAFGLHERICTNQIGRQQSMGLLNATLLSDGVVAKTGDIPLELIGVQLRDLTMHEVGHTLGLMHNFESSSAIDFGMLQDKDYTRQNGVYSSVMDYAIVNINPDRERQGYYVNPEPGAYDVFAIRFGYTPEEDKIPGILAESANPLHIYGSHEDGPNTGIDPYVNTWDLSSDLLAHARTRAELVSDIEPNLTERMVADGEYFDALRGAYAGLLFERYNTVNHATKLVGGVRLNRLHKGQGMEPMVPLSAAEQREAVEFVMSQFIDDGVIVPNETLLNRSVPSMHLDFERRPTGARDIQIHNRVAQLQGILLSNLTSATRLTRMIDNEVRMPGGAEAYTVSELFGTMTDRIWSELSHENVMISSIRRNVQRAYVDRMTQIMLNDRPFPSSPSWPEDARSIARLDLSNVNAQIESALSAGISDRTTRAHLMESHARIHQALTQSISKSLD
ncbi:MAG: zinc-dependent metalloprotease [Rhodothermales bacterium]|nr:zinc-dependent metalloprotease [Rhodothermales bacterium]MBO6780343.1 zinc-dependent metalloprotease [Rhodothermales bacterium]